MPAETSAITKQAGPHLAVSCPEIKDLALLIPISVRQTATSSCTCHVTSGKYVITQDCTVDRQCPVNYVARSLPRVNKDVFSYLSPQQTVLLHATGFINESSDDDGLDVHCAMETPETTLRDVVGSDVGIKFKRFLDAIAACTGFR